jgi:hypothetical protein
LIRAGLAAPQEAEPGLEPKSGVSQSEDEAFTVFFPAFIYSISQWVPAPYRCLARASSHTSNWVALRLRKSTPELEEKTLRRDADVSPYLQVALTIYNDPTDENDEGL